MSATIFYFSGRGNSLNVARDIANGIGDAAIVPISLAVKGEPDLSAERIGIITPVIDLGIPSIVSRFIKRLTFTDKNKYIFTVVCNGGLPAGSMSQVEKKLRSRGVKLSAGFSVGFRGNCDEWESRKDDIISVIKNKSKNDINRGKFVDRYILTGIANKLAQLIIPGEDKKFYIDENCDGCSICQKVCPVDNIVMLDKKPVWLHKCLQCASCVTCCPKRALKGKNLAARTYYINPTVEIKDFIIK